MEKSKQLTKRLTWSAFFITICAFTIFFAPKWLYFLAVEAFVILGLNDYFNLVARKRIPINKYLGLIFGAIFPLSYYFPGESIIVLIAILCLFLFNFSKDRSNQALVSVAVTLFGIFYVGWLFSFFMKLRYVEHGAFWVAFVILVTKGGDSAAYFIGRRIGKHRLVAHISPGKTIEGAVGCFLISVILAVFSKVYLPHVPLLHLFVLGTVLGVFAQLGDLVESMIKRDVGAKDSGFVPGFGGILDLLDSVLFTVPIVYYYAAALSGV